MRDFFEELRQAAQKVIDADLDCYDKDSPKNLTAAMEELAELLDEIEEWENG